MSDYLTPEEVDVLLPLLDLVGRVDYEPHDLVRLQVVEAAAKLSATLRAYAEVVEAVTEGDEWVGESSLICAWCGAQAECVGEYSETHWEAEHKPDCIYLLARKLRGHADS